MEPGLLGSPPESRDRVAVARPNVAVLDGDGAALDLHLALLSITSGDDAVHEDSVIVEEV